MRALGLFGVIVGLVEFSLWGFVSWRSRANRALEQEFRHEMSAMTPERARNQAFAVLQRSDHLSRLGPPPDQALPEAVREVFGSYHRASFSLGDVLELGKQEQGFVEVGKTFDGARLLVRAGDGGLFEWDGADVPPSGALADFPTLFHWIARQSTG